MDLLLQGDQDDQNLPPNHQSPRFTPIERDDASLGHLTMPDCALVMAGSNGRESFRAAESENDI